MLVVGLTGGIGAGKSAVARALRQRCAHLIDADQLARELLAPEGDALQEVVDAFGNGILDAQGRIDRARLAAEVFADEAARATLEAILHPRINALARRRAAAIGSRLPEAVVVYEAPLLLESGAADQVDRVLVVDVTPDVQWERAMSRGERPADQIRAIMAAQWARSDRLRHADDVIDNNGPWEDTEAQVEALMERYRALARTGGNRRR